jgi:hypothetical protein
VFPTEYDNFPHLVAEVELASEMSHILNLSQAMDRAHHNFSISIRALLQTLQDHEHYNCNKEFMSICMY